MKISLKSFTWVLVLLCTTSYAQMQEYDYKRDLKGVSDQWHSVLIPDEVFEKFSQDLSDIRIFGITANRDTVEAPYLMRLAKEKISKKDVVFKMLNVSHNDMGYYFTFEVPTTEPINQIKLEFKQENFDWLVKLEGSQNQQEWFTIIDKYRILSIKNQSTDYQFTKLDFTNSNYRYFRLVIDSKHKPDLTLASVGLLETTKGIYNDHPIKNSTAKENKQAKQTEIDIDLQMPVRVSQIKIQVADSFDYYRPITIKYLLDSIKTEKDWRYNYRTLTSGTLNSIEENEFEGISTTTEKLKILIHNQDNHPLNIESIIIRGYVHELLARFTEPADYYLTYGNNKAGQPNYDINRFTDKIPSEMSAVKIGDELEIEKEKVPVIKPLFENMNWLWAIMASMILLLGWFSVRMMRKK